MTARQKKICVSLNESGAKIADKFTLQFRTWTRSIFVEHCESDNRMRAPRITDEYEYAEALGTAICAQVVVTFSEMIYREHNTM